MSVNTKVNGELVKSAGLYKASVPIQSGDIYSFEERQIGVFADGKPLYQKTIKVPASSLTSSETTLSHGLTNVENIYEIEGVALKTGNGATPLLTYHSSSAWACGIYNVSRTSYTFFAGSSLKPYITELEITFKYTKTTDVAGSGEYVPSGDKAVHYSTDEEVIGTWIDGSTLYRKVIDCGALPNATSKNVAHGISNLGRVCKYDCTAIDTSTNIGFTPPMPISLNNTTSILIATFDATNIKFNTGTNLSNYNDCKVILEYTKTS